MVPGDPRVVESQQVQHGGVEVPDGDRVLGSPPTELVGRPVADTSLNSRAHHPAGEPVGIVVTAGRAFLMRGHPAEFGRPEDERVVEQAALFQIG